MAIIIDCHGDSHVGRRRETNEDQFLIADLTKSMRVHQTSLGLNHQSRLFGGSQGKLLVVADGLGGHQSGDRASTLAVDHLAKYMLNAMDWFLNIDSENEDEFENDLTSAFYRSQEALDAEADAIPQRRGMATTMTMAFISWPHAYVVHVGDTRCYHLSEGEIECATTDHTIGKLVEAAAAAKGEVANDEDTHKFVSKNVLWNVIGGNDQSLEPQVTKLTLQVGDSLLLCSDGLTDYLNETELSRSIQQDRPARETCEAMIEMANERGGKDNITAVLARFVESQNDLEDCEEQRIENKPEDSNPGDGEPDMKIVSA